MFSSRQVSMMLLYCVCALVLLADSRIAANPTAAPTAVPTRNPTPKPTKSPTRLPTNKPSKNPTHKPTKRPTKSPTKRPTKNPTKRPTLAPTHRPTENPTRLPTKTPTLLPTGKPTQGPSRRPTLRPTEAPTVSSFPTVITLPPTPTFEYIPPLFRPGTYAPTLFPPPTYSPTDPPSDAQEEIVVIVDDPNDGVVVTPPDEGDLPAPDVGGDQQNFLDPDTATARPTQSPVAQPEPVTVADMVLGNLPAAGQQSNGNQFPTPSRLGYVFGQVKRPSSNQLPN